MPDTTTATPDAEGCVLETYEAREPVNLEAPREDDAVVAVYVCRSHGWTMTGPQGDDARGAALVASHKAALSGRVLDPDAGALVIEVRDPSLYEHPDLVEGLRAAVGARTVVGIDPDALELYVTPDELTRETLRQALDGLAAVAQTAEVAEVVLERLKAAGCYVVRVDPERIARRPSSLPPARRGRR